MKDFQSLAIATLQSTTDATNGRWRATLGLRQNSWSICNCAWHKIVSRAWSHWIHRRTAGRKQEFHFLRGADMWTSTASATFGMQRRCGARQIRLVVTVDQTGTGTWTHPFNVLLMGTARKKRLSKKNLRIMMAGRDGRKLPWAMLKTARPPGCRERSGFLVEMVTEQYRTIMR